MRITAHQIEEAYKVAVQVNEKVISMEVGASLLEKMHGLNISSARDFINDYRLMLQGKVFQRTMSAPAIDYFLTQIAKNNGASALEVALASVNKHILYYEGIRKVNLNAMRAVVKSHEAQNSAPISLSTHESLFRDAVTKSLADEPSKRQSRLKKAEKLPVKVKAVTEIYLRNADVVAEVLSRASGSCERCKRPAPFIRKKDGTPYLEVHHIKQLAHGGEDTVSNAIALCANCHREIHYGMPHA
ncbi:MULTISPECIES: HNH endonuclease signature motif containing protein [unclassified Pseudomonas]|uniref:HNH endonuclease n=1 Tax=unclassified Pseudomonas TaxID=196821 RepID=UPI00244C47D9|nr:MULTISPECIES: HNH endonuclease signature motif containing protein [unclassified Pseudomonas]MDG9925640.1 HNH endonuclease [Pseudomonas sp. GD04045]MDH0037243.1 HNH endonuclease [Pseudomonas sp. GD04019]